MIMNKEQVLNFLPHKPPFLFIDSVQDIVLPDAIKNLNNTVAKDLVGSKVIANFKVTEDLEILKGHFPGNPILPGVVQVEMMAQASAFVSLGLKGLDRKKTAVETLLVSIEESKFRKPVVPGMELEIHATLTRCRGFMAYYACEIYHEEKKISEAKVLARLVIKEKE